MESNFSIKNGSKPLRMTLAILFSLAVCLSTLPAFAAQNEPQEEPAQVQQPPQQEPSEVQQPPEQAPPPYAQEGPPPPEYQPVPPTLTLPAKTVVSVRTSQFVSSDHSKPGDSFGAELQQPLVVNGWVVARRGQTVIGRVSVAQKAGRIKGVSQLGLELSQLVLVDGQQVPIKTQLMQTSGGTTNGRDAGAVGTTTGVGAMIGAAANGGEGAGIGAAAGATAGLIGVLVTRGRPTIIPPESLLTFQLEFPVTISTQRSVAAFRQVTQEDYAGGPLGRRPPHYANAPYPPPPPYYWGYRPWGYFYPGPVFVGYYRFGGWRHFRR